MCLYESVLGTLLAPRELSKSKLIAFRQCSKRLWLEIHEPGLREDSKSTKAIFKTGHQIGEIAQRLYDPGSIGALIDLHAEGVGPAIERTHTLLAGDLPIFEAGFAAAGGMAFADVLLPVKIDAQPRWRMVEVKSSTSVKDYYLDDIAIQSYVARASGVRLVSVSLAHIDASWCYGGDGDYHGLLVEKDLTERTFCREAEVQEWITQAQTVAALGEAPNIAIGLQCSSPFPCGFFGHCHQNEMTAQFPVTWLPRIQSKEIKSYINEHSVVDMRDIPCALLNSQQLLVRDYTVRNECFFDAAGAKQDLADYPLPAYFLDFESIQCGVPKWAGTRPFQFLPFQLSLHHIDANGSLSHQGFLDLSGDDPSFAFAHRLVDLCATQAPIFVYNTGFEGRRIWELAERFVNLRPQLLAIKKRLVDLLPIAQQRFYHPCQQGSWSIKKVIPAIAPQLRYDQLEGIQDGDMARQAYLEAIDPETTRERKQEIRLQLKSYCELDTLAMVKIWCKFAGADLSIEA